MKVYGVDIPANRGLTNIDIVYYMQKLKTPHFRGVCMRDTLPTTPLPIECGVMNLDTSQQAGSHWVCFVKNGDVRIYFDSFGQITPMEIN